MRLQGWQTPADFNMEDGDEVDVFTELLGGRTAGPCL
jgi:small ubiquitin-related modifier